jgi:hypothetical protein
MATFTHHLYVELRWLVHDRLAHPLSHALRKVGLVRLADWIHDATVPVTMAELADDDGAFALPEHLPITCESSGSAPAGRRLPI